MAGAAASVAGGSLFGFASLIWDITTNPHPWLNSLLEGAKARARSSNCDLVLLVGRGDRAFIGRCEQNDAKGVI